MTDAPIEQTGAADDQAPVETEETRAAANGWKPKDQYSGDESRWVDAETFNRRGEEILPIVRAEKKKLEAEVERLKAETAETKKAIADFRQHHTKTEERAYKRAMADLEARQAEAVEANDLKTVKSITKEMTDLATEAKGPAPTTDDAYSSPDFAKTLSTWQGDNPWYGSDRVMTAAAEAISVDLERSGVKGADQLAEVAKRIKAEFPHKFQNERRNAPATVEGGTPVRKAGKGWNDLPPDAKAFADRMVKQGLMTRETYTRDYFAGVTA